MAIRRDASASRRGHASLSAFALAVLALSVWAEPSSAVIAKIGRHAYGLTPIRGVNPARLPAVKRALSASQASASGAVPYDKAGQLVNHGGPVMHSVTTHVIYWDPSAEFTATTKAVVNKFFADVAHDSGLGSNVFGIAGQYNDGAGHALYSSTVESEATDGNAYPLSGCSVPSGADKGPPYTHCVTDEQLQSELSSYVAAHSLPTGPTQQYFVLLPHKVVTCLPEEEVEPGVFVHPCSNNYYCAYHSSIEGGTANEIIYSDIPFSLLDSGHVKGCQSDGNGLQHPNGDIEGTNETTRYADVALKYTSHEYIEAATDPLGNAWWEEAHGQEIGDKCNTAGSGSEPGEDPNAFLPTLGGSASSGTLFNQSINGDSFYLQSEWDNTGVACLMRPLALSGAKFTASPTSGIAGTPVKFSGAATDPYGGLGFNWKFGDGTESAGAAPAHVYSASGSYEVTMTVKDEFTGSTSPPVLHTFSVVDEQPTAAFSFEPNPAEAGKPVSFNGAGSNDPDGSITGYLWQFGDGTESTAEAPAHSYAFPGSYTVTLTVTDSATQTATITHPVTVNGLPTVVTGTASALGPSSATLNATVNPNGANVTECKFEYGTTPTYGFGSPCASAPGSGNSVVSVSASLASLSANTLYHFRIVAKNSFGAQEGVDHTFTTTSPNALVETLTQPFTPQPTPVPAPAANSAFGAAGATFNPQTGTVTFSASVADPGTFRWLLTFQNGKFGVFGSRVSACRRGLVKLKGECRPSRIVFAKGSKTVPAPGTVTFTVKPSAAALKALRNALKQNKGLPVTAKVTFQSSRGGSPVSHTQTIVVKLKKH
jgi:PKD repeat protein